MGAVLAPFLFRPKNVVRTHPFKLKLPQTIHELISKQEIGERRVLVIGDVHGCLDELQNLLTINSVTPENTLIIFCGDIINKGPKSLETLRFVRSLRGAYCVRGNHEEHVLKNHRDWTEGKCALRAEWMRSLTAEDLVFLNDLPYTISIPSLKAIIVHAALDPWLPMYQQQPSTMTEHRNIVNGDFADYRLSKHIGEGTAWAGYWNGPEHVYFGHDAVRGLQRKRFATGLDTGCLYGNSLTAAFIHPTWKLVSVPAKEQYVKPGK